MMIDFHVPSKTKSQGYDTCYIDCDNVVGIIPHVESNRYDVFEGSMILLKGGHSVIVFDSPWEVIYKLKGGT